MHDHAQVLVLDTAAAEAATAAVIAANNIPHRASPDLRALVERCGESAGGPGSGVAAARGDVAAVVAGRAEAR